MGQRLTFAGKSYGTCGILSCLTEPSQGNLSGKFCFMCQMNGELLGVWRSDLLSQVRGSWGLGSSVFQGWEVVNESVGELTAAG